MNNVNAEERLTCFGTDVASDVAIVVTGKKAESRAVAGQRPGPRRKSKLS